MTAPDPVSMNPRPESLGKCRFCCRFLHTFVSMNPRPESLGKGGSHRISVSDCVSMNPRPESLGKAEPGPGRDG